MWMNHAASLLDEQPNHFRSENQRVLQMCVVVFRGMLVYISKLDTHAGIPCRQFLHHLSLVILWH